MAEGFVYLVAITDWYSRRIVSWRLSMTLGTRFCINALQEALELHGKPAIFNSAQGSQFTDSDFTKLLKKHGIKVMHGRQRALSTQHFH